MKWVADPLRCQQRPPTYYSNFLPRHSKMDTYSSQSGRSLTAFASIMKEKDYYAAREKGI